LKKDTNNTWRRSTRAVGGYWMGSFQLDPRRVSRLAMDDFYNTQIGSRLVETTGGITTWEGLIVQMDYTVGGLAFRTTLDSEHWHNYVDVSYSSDLAERERLGWSENTDSSDIFGRMDYLDSLPGATATTAAALQDRRLSEFAWPRSRMVGGATFEGGRVDAGDRRLDVTVAGYWSTLNWRYQEASFSDGADDGISTLVGNSEFVTAGRLEDNTMTVKVKAERNPVRLGDMIKRIIEQGDTSGNVWQGGVYRDREFVYEQAPTAVEYYIRNGRLVDKGGTPVIPTLLEPGFLVKNSAAPTGWQPPGTSTAWDDPTVAYVDEVEFQAPDILRLSFFGEEESVITLEQQIQAGTVAQNG
jgi:hypothetical protein